MFKRFCLLASLLGSLAFFSSKVSAELLGPCLTDSTYIFNAVIDKTITDASQNTAGTIFPDFWSWDLGGGYSATCSCPDDKQEVPVYYKTETSLQPGYSDASHQYFVIDNHIQIAADIWIQGRKMQYVSMPLMNESNEYPIDQCNSTKYFDTGRKGKLSLYINHPFVGQLDIPPTRIFDLFGTNVSGVYSTIPLSSVSLSGQIIVPQGCEMATGSTLEIPFGEFQAYNFKDRKGQQPAGFSPISKTLEFKCTNIADGIKIYLRVEGTPNANDSNAIDLGNPDIGAVMETSTGKILIPNDSQGQELDVSALTDDTHRTASTSLKFYPISTTGKMPATGDFEGIATLRIDVE